MGGSRVIIAPRWGGARKVGVLKLEGGYNARRDGSGRDAMTHDHEHNHSHDYHHAPGDFVGAKPILNVANVAASLAYYVERLGFELVFAWCDETGFDSPRVPTFGEVRRGHAAIMLAQAAQG